MESDFVLTECDGAAAICGADEQITDESFDGTKQSFNLGFPLLNQVNKLLSSVTRVSSDHSCIKRFLVSASGSIPKPKRPAIFLRQALDCSGP